MPSKWGNNESLLKREPDNTEWLRNIVIAKGPEGAPALRTTPAEMSRITTPGPCRIGTPWNGGYVSLGAGGR